MSPLTPEATEDRVALRHDVAAVTSPRDVIIASGPDAIGYLQGQLSQDVEGLSPGRSVRSLVLEPGGRVDAWMRVWGRDGDEVLIDLEAGAGEALLGRLERFRLRVDVAFHLSSWTLVALRGPATPPAQDLARATGAELVDEVDWAGLSGIDLLGPAVTAPAGIRPAGADALEVVRIEAGLPAMGSELGPGLDPLVIPAEAGEWLVDRSVSFTKGCYVGQELVARVDSRGSNTPRNLRGVVIRGEEVPPAGAELVVDGKVRGSVTSAGWSAELEVPVALAYVHRSVEPGATGLLGWDAPDGRAPSCEAQVRALPLVRG
jgi:tRNA-modifying protein YgfZ